MYREPVERILYTIIATFFFFITTPGVLITIPEKMTIQTQAMVHNVVFFIAVYFSIRFVDHYLGMYLGNI